MLCSLQRGGWGKGLTTNSCGTHAADIQRYLHVSGSSLKARAGGTSLDIAWTCLDCEHAGCLPTCLGPLEGGQIKQWHAGAWGLLPAAGCMCSFMRLPQGPGHLCSWPAGCAAGECRPGSLSRPAFPGCAGLGWGPCQECLHIRPLIISLNEHLKPHATNSPVICDHSFATHPIIC